MLCGLLIWQGKICKKYRCSGVVKWIAALVTKQYL